MTCADLDLELSAGDPLVNQIRDDLLRRLRLVGKDLWASQLAEWEDLAKAEDSIHREYSGRYLFELLQNANDAISDGLSVSGPIIGRVSGSRVLFQLTKHSLLIANTGAPFREENIRALCRLHNTTKTASKQVGHKGIGFKSVLEITDRPEIFSKPFAFSFNRRQFAHEVRDITGDSGAFEGRMPYLRAPYPRRVSSLPLHDRERIEELLDSEGFATIIRLPFRTAETPDQVERKLRGDISPRLLLFLNAIDRIEIRYLSGDHTSYWRDDPDDHGLGMPSSEEVRLWSDQSSCPTLESRWVVVRSGELAIPDRGMLEGLDEAWKDVKAVRCTVAFPLTLDGGNLKTDLDSQPLHVYFPTEEFCGLRFIVNADFYIEAARKDVRRNTLNDWLSRQLANFIAADGIRALCTRFPGDPGIVDMLAPLRKPERQFASYLQCEYMKALSKTRFVPIAVGTYRFPADIRLAPFGADLLQFREFFTPDIIAADVSWSFPVPAVETRELERVKEGRPFLLSSELGASQIEIHEIAAVLQDGPPKGAEAGPFLSFLSHWWDSQGRPEREKLQHALSECCVVPTLSGWKCASNTLIFQANLREEKDIFVPPGFDFDLVPLDAYGHERSYQATPARLLDALGVAPYQAREILRRAILPTLCSPEKFRQLNEGHPGVIQSVYTFLRGYHERDRSTAEIRDDLDQVPVPAYPGNSPSEVTWHPAGSVYFSSFWTGNTLLEEIYGEFNDVHFMGPVPGLARSEAIDDKEIWYSFFSWLGVSAKPRIIEGRGSAFTFSSARLHHPFCTRAFWPEYLGKYEGNFECGNPTRNHGRSRRLGTTWALDHLEGIIATRNIQTYRHLFRLLALHWDYYHDHLLSQINCEYVSTGCAPSTIPSYLAYCLREREWIPGVIWDGLSTSPFRGTDIWNLGEDVRPDVRRTLPSLPEEFSGEQFRGIRVDLLKTEFAFADYIGLLQRLPSICPLEPFGLDGDILKKWQDAVRATFNWLAQAIQNSLYRLGDENRPERPPHLSILAFRGDTPCYVDVDSITPVYPDSALLAKTWQKDLPFFRAEEGWGNLREWLGIPKLSDMVLCEVDPSDEAESDTDLVRARFRQTLPYFLALVHEQQNSRFDLVFGRLQRLDLHVVGTLGVRQSVPKLDVPARVITERAYLQQRDDPNPRGGRPIRAGDLYIAHPEVNNPDILGSQVASYIEIDRLSDAFILLYSRHGHEECMRFLESRGVNEETVRAIASRLQTDAGDDSLPRVYGGLAKALRESAATVTLPPSVPPPPPPQEEPPREMLPVAEPPAPQPSEIAPLPPLDTRAAVGVETYRPGDQEPKPERQPREGGVGDGGGGIGTAMTEEERIALGTRGEKWALEAERQRLRELGFDPEQLERQKQLDWVSQREKRSPFDIRSIDVLDGEVVEIYIEVKSTTGSDRRAVWPIGEFRWALSHGDRYWLYLVTHVEQARPDNPIRFQNPIQLWQERHIQIDFRQLQLTLPAKAEESQNPSVETMSTSQSTV